jgi:hypothetical protein
MSRSTLIFTSVYVFASGQKSEIQAALGGECPGLKYVGLTCLSLACFICEVDCFLSGADLPKVGHAPFSLQNTMYMDRYEDKIRASPMFGLANLFDIMI